MLCEQSLTKAQEPTIQTVLSAAQKSVEEELPNVHFVTEAAAPQPHTAADDTFRAAVTVDLAEWNCCTTSATAHQRLFFEINALLQIATAQLAYSHFWSSTDWRAYALCSSKCTQPLNNMCNDWTSTLRVAEAFLSSNAFQSLAWHVTVRHSAAATEYAQSATIGLQCTVQSHDLAAANSACQQLYARYVLQLEELLLTHARNVDVLVVFWLRQIHPFDHAALLDNTLVEAVHGFKTASYCLQERTLMASDAGRAAAHEFQTMISLYEMADAREGMEQLTLAHKSTVAFSAEPQVRRQQQSRLLQLYVLPPVEACGSTRIRIFWRRAATDHVEGHLQLHNRLHISPDSDRWAIKNALFHSGLQATSRELFAAPDVFDVSHCSPSAARQPCAYVKLDLCRHLATL